MVSEMRALLQLEMLINLFTASRESSYLNITCWVKGGLWLTPVYLSSLDMVFR